MPPSSSAETRGGLHYVVGRRVDPKLTERKSFNFIIQFFFGSGFLPRGISRAFPHVWTMSVTVKVVDVTVIFCVCWALCCGLEMNPLGFMLIKYIYLESSFHLCL